MIQADYQNSKNYAFCRHCAQSDPDSSSLSPGWSESENTCQDSLLTDQCLEAGGSCVTTQEGFYTMSGVWLTFGALWFVWIFRALRQLQTIEPGEWRVLKREGREEGGSDRGKKFRYFSVRNDEERETK